MAEVTGSKQYRSIVVQDRPGLRAGVIISVVVFIAIIASLVYWLSTRSNPEQLQQLITENEQLKSQLSDVSANFEEVSQNLANIKTGADIDRQAVNQVRAVVSEHKQTINELNEEISFYKGLMSPTETEKGLGIRSWELYPGKSPRHHQFKLVIQQLAVKHSILKGAVNVDIVGKRAGVEETLSLDILSQQIETASIKLRFKYFQYINGELELPIGFVPERIEIVAKATTPKKVTVEKLFGWVVQ